MSAATLQAILHLVDDFDLACQEAEYTDTDQAWDVFHQVQRWAADALAELGAEA